VLEAGTQLRDHLVDRAGELVGAHGNPAANDRQRASAAAFLRGRRIEISGINKSHCPNRLLFGRSLACKENHLVAKQESTMIGRGLRLRTLGTALLLLSALSVSGCGVVFFGAAAGGGGYETYQHDQMQKLEQEYAAGEIDQAQFEARKRRIQQSSLLQE
jgi:hypothetical protein